MIMFLYVVYRDKEINVSPLNSIAMLYEILRDIKGCQFAHVVLKTRVGVPKKLGLGDVEKIFDGSVQLNYSYENAVNNRLEKKGLQGDFETLPLPWGGWEIPNKIITYKGKKYMRYYLVNCVDDAKKPKVHFLVNGRDATDSEIEVIKPYANKSYSNRQAVMGLTENQVSARVVEFCNVIEVSVGGKRYKK